MVEGQERMVHAEGTVQNIADLSVGISSPYPSTSSFSLVGLVETSFSLGGGLMHMKTLRALPGLKLLSNEYLLKRRRSKV